MTLSERILDKVRERSQGDHTISEETLLTDLHIDSLAFMDLVMQIEEAEGIMLTDLEVERLLEAIRLKEVITIFGSAVENDETKCGPAT